MRVLAAVAWLAAAVAALQLDLKAVEREKAKAAAEAHEALEKATPEQKKAIDQMYEEKARSERTEDAKGPQRDGTVIKWHSMSEVRRLQSEGRKLVIARIEPIDTKGFERRLEVLAAELRARGAEEATWVKRSVPGDDDVAWLHWEQVPVATQIFVVTGKQEEPARVYKGSDSLTDLLTWLLDALPPPRPKEIKTEKELDEFMLAGPVSVIAYVPSEMGADGSFHEFVRKIALRHPYLPVGLIYPAEELSYSKHTLAPIAIYYRDEDRIFPLDEDRLQEMDDFTRDNALKKASHQFISRFPDDAQHIFSQGIDKIVFVFDSVGHRRGQTPTYLRELALEMRQRVVIAYVDAKDERMDGVRKFFGVELTEAVRGFDARTERQYWPARAQGVAFPHEVQAFVRDLASNKLSPHRKVEQIDLKINEDGATLKLNSDTFETLALDPSTDTVVCFYAVWCPHSKRFLERFLRAGQESIGKRKVLFAVVDVEKNDVETKNKIRTFPTVILFRKTTNEEVVFTGRRNLIEFLRWLDEEMERTPKEEEPEVNESALDYESPLTKKIKLDAEQQYTLDGLNSLVRSDAKRSKGKKTEEVGVQREQMTEKVLEKLKVDKSSIVEILEMSRQARGVDERSTVEEKEKDTVAEKKDTVTEKKDTVAEKKKDTVTEKDTVVEKKKDSVTEKEEDTVEKKEQDPKEKTSDPAVKKSTKIDQKPDTVEKPKSTVVDTPEKKENTVDPKETPKRKLERQDPVKSEL